MEIFILGLVLITSIATVDLPCKKTTDQEEVEE
jgi:hypothetical protein